jgi:recombination protein RecR
LSPLDGVCPENLRIRELCSRVKSSKPAEVIVATDSDSEGETTALYLARILKKEKVKVTRIAYGLPMGSNLEYADQLTLSKAMKGRQGFYQRVHPCQYLP